MKGSGRKFHQCAGLWLGLCLGMCLTGCLDEPPEYTAAVRIPPIVDFSGVVPASSVVQQVMVGDPPLKLIVPFRSEDLDDEVIAVLFLDAIPGEMPRVLSDEKMNPSTFDQARTFEIDVPDLGAPGCHTLTLLLTHLSNTTAFRFDVVEESLATRVTWVLAVHKSPTEILLSDCPVQGLQQVSR